MSTLKKIEDKILDYAWNNGEIPLTVELQDLNSIFAPIKTYIYEDIKNALSVGFNFRLALALAGKDY